MDTKWYDGGIVWAQVRRWILVMRRCRAITTKQLAAKEWELLDETLGSDRTIADLCRWFSETYSDEMKEMVRDELRLQSGNPRIRIEGIRYDILRGINDT